MVNIHDKVIRPDGLTAWLRGRGCGGSAAIVTGTYDIFQPGNLKALMRARALASTVLVILEADEQVALHASVGRPQNPLEVRIELVAGMRLVDGVTWGGISKECFAGFKRVTWVIGGAQREGDPFRAMVDDVIDDVVEMESLDRCFTEDIVRSIKENRTPIGVPAKEYGDLVVSGRDTAWGRRVTVNGCFDILHIGHLRFLAQARSLGDSLTVLMNDDESVARYKGPARPVFPAVFRAAALKALTVVDEVLPFSGDDPLDVINKIRPAIHVKGGSFEPERVRQERELVESWGGCLVGTPMVEGYSTTEYIRKAMAG